MDGKRSGDMSVEEKRAPQGAAEHAYAEMLLRQHPWLRDELSEGESPEAFSYRKPESLTGVFLTGIGLFVIADTLLHLSAFGGVLTGALIALAGAAIFYGGIWILRFAGRAWVLVTPERLLYRHIDLFGKPGRTLTIPRAEIRSARFLKSTVMYRITRSDGEILVTRKSGKTVLLPVLRDGEAVLEALR